jgi:hypothetical protein
LDFFPEERFSMPARLLLSGLIKRDPSTRLGAWENPPQDIMSSSFFDGIKWDKIYERSSDGPYIPEPVNFTNARKSSLSKNTSEQNTVQAGGNVDAVTSAKNSHKKSTLRGHNKKGGNDSDDDSGSELQGMRDSVFIRPHDGNGNNLLDWSFIDEKVLVSSIKDPSSSEVDKTKTDNLSNDTTSRSSTEQVISTAAIDRPGEKRVEGTFPTGEDNDPSLDNSFVVDQQIVKAGYCDVTSGVCYI